jgi:hypothetical protein
MEKEIEMEKEEELLYDLEKEAELLERETIGNRLDVKKEIQKYTAQWISFLKETERILEIQADKDPESIQKFLLEIKKAKETKQKTKEIITIKEEWQILKNSICVKMSFEPRPLPDIFSFGCLGDTEPDAMSCVVLGNIGPGFIARDPEVDFKFHFTIESRNRQGHKKNFKEADFVVTLSRPGSDPCLLIPKLAKITSERDKDPYGGVGYVYTFSLPPLSNPSIFQKLEGMDFVNAIHKDIRNQEWELSILLGGKHVDKSPYSSKTSRIFNPKGKLLGKLPITLEMAHVIIGMVIANGEMYILSGTKTNSLVTRIHLETQTSFKFRVPCLNGFVPVDLAVGGSTRIVILLTKIVYKTKQENRVLISCFDAKGQSEVQFNPKFPLFSCSRIAAGGSNIAIYDRSQIQLYTQDGKFLSRTLQEAEIHCVCFVRNSMVFISDGKIFDLLLNSEETTPTSTPNPRLIRKCNASFLAFENGMFWIAFPGSIECCPEDRVGEQWIDFASTWQVLNFFKVRIGAENGLCYVADKDSVYVWR